MTTDTRAALLDAAEHAVRSQGVDGFSYADLSAAVGIRKASIHYHFPTKSQLTAEVMRRYRERMTSVCDDISAGAPDAATCLTGIIDVYRDALNEGRTLCLCVALGVSRDSLDAKTMAEIADFRDGMTDWLQAVFAQGAADGTIPSVTDPLDEARATLALLEGAHLAARASKDVSLFDAATALLSARCRAD